jgi:hypothetical protein
VRSQLGLQPVQLLSLFVVLRSRRGGARGNDTAHTHAISHALHARRPQHDIKAAAATRLEAAREGVVDAQRRRVLVDRSRGAPERGRSSSVRVVVVVQQRALLRGRGRGGGGDRRGGLLARHGLAEEERGGRWLAHEGEAPRYGRAPAHASGPAARAPLPPRCSSDLRVGPRGCCCRRRSCLSAVGLWRDAADGTALLGALAGHPSLQTLACMPT